MNLQKSLRLKLLCVVFAMVLVFLLIFGTLTVHTAEASYRTDIPRSLGIQLSSACRNLERDMFQMMRIPRIFSSNKDIRDYLLCPSSRVQLGQTLVAMTDIETFMFGSSSYDHLAKLILLPNKHDFHMNLGRISGHSSDLEIFRRIEKEMPDTQSLRIIPSPFFYSSQSGNRFIIPLVEPVYFLDSASQIGTAYIAVGSNLVSDQFSTYFKEGNHSVYIRSDETVYQMTEDGFRERPDLFTALAAPAVETYQNGAYLTDTIASMDDQSVIGYHIDLVNWTVFMPVPSYHLQLPENFGRLMCFALFASVICIIIVYMILHHIVAKPVAAIQHQLHALTLGDFSQQPPLSSDDEFGMISNDIKEMSGAILHLMQTQLKDEQKRNRLSFRALQGQITPHFLYNTLNSIRWLGEINGVPGMSEITSALMRMLRHITHIDSDLCTLREELDFVHDYEIIQSYRYGSAFRLRYRIDDALLGATIIKFILQPLVENAMFYGIDSSGHTVLIDIHAYREGDDLLLAVTDNGVGIPEETLCQLRRNAYRTQRSNGASGIALHNIHERLTMEYGPRYGISIRSAVGHYTQITVRAPFITQEEDLNREE